MCGQLFKELGLRLEGDVSEVKCMLWQIQELSSFMIRNKSHKSNMLWEVSAGSRYRKPWSPYQDRSGWIQMGGAHLPS